MADLTEVLKHYGVEGVVASETEGPLVKLIEFTPVAGTKLKNITANLDDIAREYGVSSMRVETLNENGNIGFEVPARETQIIDFSSILKSEAFANAKGNIPICLGVDIKGYPVFADLAKMPHLLIAGTTGSGKSVGLNTFILSLIKRKKPTEVKFVLVDPKRIEFSIYNNQKYLYCPVITETSDAAAVLNLLVEEMERRYNLLEENGVKNIGEYNEFIGLMPYIVCVIDEFADLIASTPKVEQSVQRLAQKARAAGIHLILATQRPSVDVVTGVIKANFPTRLSYKVASSADSRTILDSVGAEKLLGRGDCLFLASNGELQRIHGAYMPDNQIEGILEPFRAAIKPLDLKKETEQQDSKPTTIKKEKGFFRKLWDFWVSMRVRDRKMVINGIMSVFALFVKNSKSRR